MKGQGFMNKNQLASIQYVGRKGITQSCINAIMRFIHFGDTIQKAKLLSCIDKGGVGRHCFLLTVNGTEDVIIKSGFSSGYKGAGPAGLSAMLAIFYQHQIEVSDYEVSFDFIEKANYSCLLKTDLEYFSEIRQNGYRAYMDFNESDLKDYFPVTLALSLIDQRIMDLALGFKNNPSHCIDKGYKRLEDTVRNRTGLSSENGAKLFSKAFLGSEAILHWESYIKGEHQGRASLFSNIFMAYRNPRAHKEIKSTDKELAREFMLMNELFILENNAVKK